MELLVDTNIFVSNLVDEPGRGEIATELLDSEHELYTTILNLMELRSVLVKKERQEADRVRETVAKIPGKVGLLIPDAGDMMAANNYQNETWLYTMDAIIATLAKRNDLTLVTFDSELLEHDAVAPESIL